jgi:hypothetical protein
VGIAKALFVGTTLNVAGASTLAAITGTFNGTVGATTPAAGAFTTLSATGITTVAAGSAALPAIVSTTGTADTGLWFPAADTVAASTAGTERLRIDSSGNVVGIGTSSPAVKLHVYSTASDGANMRLQSTGGSIVAKMINNDNGYKAWVGNDGTNDQWAVGQWGLTGANLGFYTGSGLTERMRIDSSGNVGIGTSSPGALLHVGTTTAKIRIGATAGSEYLDISRDSATGNMIYNAAQASYGTHNFQIAGTEAMRIDSSGNLLVARTSVVNQGRISVDMLGGTNVGLSVVNTNSGNTGNFCNFARSDTTVIGSIQQNGASAVTYSTSSDYRLKEDIAPMTGALAKVALLKPCTYKWKVDGSDGQGFIAHELDEVVPGCVTGEKDATCEEEYEVTPAVPAVLDADGKETIPAVQAVKGTRTVPSYQGVDTSFLVATLTAAIQELKAIIDTQATRIAALEAKA